VICGAYHYPESGVNKHLSHLCDLFLMQALFQSTQQRLACKFKDKKLIKHLHNCDTVEWQMHLSKSQGRKDWEHYILG